MSIDFSLWSENIRNDLRALSDSAYQADSFSGRLQNADSHPGETIATIWDDDRLVSFVGMLPNGEVQKAGLEVIAVINRLAEKVNFDDSWQQIVSCNEWQQVVQAATAMLKIWDRSSEVVPAKTESRDGSS